MCTINGIIEKKNLSAVGHRFHDWIGEHSLRDDSLAPDGVTCLAYVFMERSNQSQSDYDTSISGALLLDTINRSTNHM